MGGSSFEHNHPLALAVIVLVGINRDFDMPVFHALADKGIMIPRFPLWRSSDANCLAIIHPAPLIGCSLDGPA